MSTDMFLRRSKKLFSFYPLLSTPMDFYILQWIFPSSSKLFTETTSDRNSIEFTRC